MPCHERLLEWSPGKNPRVWFWINVFWILISLLVGIDLLYATEELSERPFANSFYLLYNFGLCLTWCMEFGLNLVWKLHPSSVTEWSIRAKAEVVIEGLLAVYFLWDAISLVYEWHVLNDELIAEILDVCVEILAYLWMAVVTRKQMLEKEKEDDGRQQPLMESPVAMEDAQGTLV